jgi:hypothetical protein
MRRIRIRCSERGGKRGAGGQVKRPEKKVPRRQAWPARIFPAWRGDASACVVLDFSQRDTHHIFLGSSEKSTVSSRKGGKASSRKLVRPLAYRPKQLIPTRPAVYKLGNYRINRALIRTPD